MQIITLIVVLALAIAVQFAPMFFGESCQGILQALAGVAAFILGMTQGAFGKYLADSWTDQRRKKERSKKLADDAANRNERFLPLFQLIRNILGDNEEGFNNDLEVVMARKYSFAKGKLLRVVVGDEFNRLSTMVKRLASTGDLSISKDEDDWIQFRMSDETYQQILQLEPVSG